MPRRGFGGGAFDSAERAAYEAGWNASKNSKTYDLDAAEARYERKHANPAAMFSAGWADYAADRPKYSTLAKETKR